MSTITPPEREQQSFAETALRLGGKSEEEATRIGAVDRADEQVESLFKPQYQTAHSPIHRAVWDGKADNGNPSRDTAAIFKRTGDAVANAYREFAGMSPEAIRRQRHEKFLAIGRNL